MKFLHVSESIIKNIPSNAFQPHMDAFPSHLDSIIFKIVNSITIENNAFAHLPNLMRIKLENEINPIFIRNEIFGETLKNRQEYVKLSIQEKEDQQNGEFTKIDAHAFNKAKVKLIIDHYNRPLRWNIIKQLVLLLLSNDETIIGSNECTQCGLRCLLLFRDRIRCEYKADQEYSEERLPEPYQEQDLASC